MKISNWYIVILLFCCLPNWTVAQEAFQRENWEKATEGIDYREDPPEPKKTTKDRPAASDDSDFNFSEFFKSFDLIFKVLGYLLLLLVVVFALIKLLPGIGKNKKITSFNELQSDPNKLEDHLKQLDFDALVKEAVGNSAYALAIRLYYLRILRVLWDKKYIAWRKQKTDYDYILETENQPFASTFQSLTQQFERHWYGEKATTELLFKRYEREARELLNRLNG